MNINMNMEEKMMSNETNGIIGNESEVNTNVVENPADSVTETTGMVENRTDCGVEAEAGVESSLDPKPEETMVEVFEAEYYRAKARHDAGQEPVPSIFQTSEFGPFLNRDMIERCIGDEEIPVEELAVKENYRPEHIAVIESAKAAGVFRGGKGTVLVPETNGVVYAGIWETEKHIRVIRVLFRSQQGIFSTPIELEYATFVIAAQSDFLVEDKGSAFSKDVVKFHKKAVLDIINRLPLGTGINYDTTLKMLWKHLQNLPVHELIEEEASIETIYSEIVRYVDGRSDGYFKAKTYFRLRSSDLDNIAYELSMKPTAVCAKLKEYGLLYLTPSSRGYQTKVKYEGMPENFYCVLKKFGTHSTPQYTPTVLEDGTQVMHDGTVKAPLSIYQQLFGGVPKGSNGSEEAEKANLKPKGYLEVDW